jgi:hypothetical protein
MGGENNYTEMVTLESLLVILHAHPASRQQWIYIYLHGFEILEN